MLRPALVFLSVSALLGPAAIASDVLSPSPPVLAHYPLQTDGVDATGNYGPMTLTNTSFQDGGVYCNGIYPGGDPEACVVQTPSIEALDFESFAISAEFKIDEYPTVHPYRPVFMGGPSWRWMGADVYPDSTIGLRYNSASFGVRSDVEVSLDTWHQVIITYDGSVDTGRLYLDEQLVIEETFVIEHGDEREIATHNASSGQAFLGLFRELVIFGATYDPTPTDGTTWGAIKASFR
ncbi:LamG-like jellyroll fold domain-containing protein [Candidatus Eisenbacteria bacterium]|uniref:LamG-like jellyroll fold domain-containing protein n=1 Tax=Eiseniibacteriota bacterium TaxID=2212470 RepID=A0ABV6YJN6_UNCEI